MGKSRGGVVDALVVALGLTLALVVTTMVIAQDEGGGALRVTSLFVVTLIVVPFFSALIGLQVARRVRAPGSPWLWAVLAVFLPFAGVILIAVLGVALGGPHSRRPSTS